MSAQSPDGPDPRPRAVEDFTELERVLVRIAWADRPEVTLHWLPKFDALVVEILPLPSVSDVVVHELLAIEFDGDDREALPTRICLTGVRRHPDSPAQRRVHELLGRTLMTTVQALVAANLDTKAELTVGLTPEVLDSRIRHWRRLRGVAVGVDIRPGEMDVVVHGPDVDDVLLRSAHELQDMGVDAVVAAVRDATRAALRETDREIAGAPVVLGVQLPGPVDHRTGMVHHFRKRSRRSGASWQWTDVPLGWKLTEATGLPVRVVNDVVGYATYERWTNPRPEDDIRAVLLVSQGIGAKLIVGGLVDDRLPMEIGNIVLDSDGRPCDCGSRGCVEATAGTLAVLEQIEEETGRTVEDLASALALVDGDGHEPDPAVVTILRRAGEALARGVGFVQAIANPKSWAVYGPYPLLAKDANGGNEFLAALDSYPTTVAFKPYQQAEIERRPIEATEGAEGVALHALEHHGSARPASLGSPIAL